MSIYCDLLLQYENKWLYNKSYCKFIFQTLLTRLLVVPALKSLYFLTYLKDHFLVSRKANIKESLN
jgi:hypothetical protein